MMTGTTNPAPYILAAYMIGMLCTFGFSLWLYIDRLRVERYLKALNQENE